MSGRRLRDRRGETASRGCRSTRRTACTARPATSRTRRRTSTGWCRKGAAGRTIRTCEAAISMIFSVSLRFRAVEGANQAVAALAIGLAPRARARRAASTAADAGGSVAAVEPGQTLTGNYLAARHAARSTRGHRRRDVSLAALDEVAGRSGAGLPGVLALLLDGRVAGGRGAGRRKVDRRQVHDAALAARGRRRR